LTAVLQRLQMRGLQWASTGPASLHRCTFTPAPSPQPVFPTFSKPTAFSLDLIFETVGWFVFLPASA